MTFAADGAVVHRFPLDAADANATLRYVAVDGERIVVKALDQESGGHLAWYDPFGTRLLERKLDGAYWRHSGLLKTDGDSLLSLRGYLPLIDVYSDATKVDSVALFGFDSPMLARTRLFEGNSAKAPPLLSSSSAACGNFWYVLNIRPGWVRVDKYDRTGKLQQAFTQPDPTFDSKQLTTDLAVSCGAETLVAITIANPVPEVRWYAIP